MGVRILAGTSEGTVPVLALKVYDPEIPGDREACEVAARRMAYAVRSRLAEAPVVAEPALRSKSGGRIEFLDATSGGVSV